MLGEVERGLSADLHKVLHEAESNAAQYVTEEVFSHHFDKAEREYYILRSLLRPYLEGGRGSKADASGLIAAWEQEFGAIDNPAVQESIDKFVDDTNKVLRETEDARNPRPVKRKRENVQVW